MSKDRSSPRPTLDISVESDLWSLPDVEALCARAIGAALDETGQRIMDGAEVSLLFCDDSAIRDLNRDWRGFDKPTNVLSFPAVTPDRLARSPMIGDIAVAQETCAREAEADGKSFEDHVSHLVLHGFLHLLGYDHETEEEAEEMEAVERRALARIGIADPYAGTEPEGAR